MEIRTESGKEPESEIQTHPDFRESTEKTTKKELPSKALDGKEHDKNIAMDDPSPSGRLKNINEHYRNLRENYKRNQCHPECTAQYCADNPRALCSGKAFIARKDEKKCSDPCGTTVCRACEVTFDPYKSCQLCSKGSKDQSCIKEFGRCVKKGLAAVRRLDLYQTQTGFNCAIPTC